MAFGTGESVLFMGVSLVQGCLYKEVPYMKFCLLCCQGDASYDIRRA